MNKHSIQLNSEELKEFQIPAFGYELLREVLLPSILGKEHAQMLYWAGKDLARKYPLNSVEDLILFFNTAGWGSLQLLKQTKHDLEFELSSELISQRIAQAKDCSFQLEAGFIAEQLQTINGFITETHEQVKRRARKVVFTAKWDQKDKLEPSTDLGSRKEKTRF
ncbi:YslB family protein [Metabacillus malikii]|uniref:Hydrocarbon binding protein n=1 Tax=Metabacillus malikii TaxID=1504265 RepID=A0ABT9ZG57_9BACI|nr:YslB family protein [Metabacillus malikii]MDQ0230970.1 putative hydrocarbon binding protein [Metabacillus malikii]